MLGGSHGYADQARRYLAALGRHRRRRGAWPSGSSSIYAWAARLSGPVLAVSIAMLLANLRVMPPKAPVYDVVHNELVPLALPLLLFRANVPHIVRTTGWLFLAFHVSAAGTVAGRWRPRRCCAMRCRKSRRWRAS